MSNQEKSLKVSLIKLRFIKKSNQNELKQKKQLFCWKHKRKSTSGHSPLNFFVVDKFDSSILFAFGVRRKIVFGVDKCPVLLNWVLFGDFLDDFVTEHIVSFLFEFFEKWRTEILLAGIDRCFPFSNLHVSLIFARKVRMLSFGHMDRIQVLVEFLLCELHKILVLLPDLLWRVGVREFHQWTKWYKLYVKKDKKM